MENLTGTRSLPIFLRSIPQTRQAFSIVGLRVLVLKSRMSANWRLAIAQVVNSLSFSRRMTSRTSFMALTRLRVDTAMLSVAFDS